MLRHFCGLVCLATLFLPSGNAETPAVIAIRNAKIVTVSGPVIAKGTVVVRNGLIEAVGENAAAPADAWIIDGAGLTVYPGFDRCPLHPWPYGRCSDGCAIGWGPAWWWASDTHLQRSASATRARA
ncbi:MAG: hypothetical protein U0R19_04555 [Bryobacteraceae bacterium]